MDFRSCLYLYFDSAPAVVYAGAETETAQEDENGEMSWVFDDCGILSDDEITELNDELATIYDTYGYDAVLWISQDVGEDEDYRQYAAEFMQANEIGYGDTHEGMCIFHQPGVRNITIVFRGDKYNEFSVRGGFFRVNYNYQDKYLLEETVT